MTRTDVEKKYYCSQKFWWLSIDLEKIETLSCCAASPSKIDLTYIRSNPGELFNSPIFIQDRQQMLTGQSVGSCSAACWIPESQGKTSRRLSMDSNLFTHSDIHASPETLHIIVGTDCNMACVYCCKQYSSSWAQDLKNYGDYQMEIGDRFRLNQKDRIRMKISQKELANSQFSSLLLDEIHNIYRNNNLKDITITGGEPFLYLGLEKLIASISDKNIPVKIWTGLGVDPKRFYNEASKMLNYPYVGIVISNETIGNLYELVRNGNSWKQFETNLNILDNLGLGVSFYSTITNLSMFGLLDFVRYVQGRSIEYTLCTDPSFLSPNVLDPESKNQLLSSIDMYPFEIRETLRKNLQIETTPYDRDLLKIYLKEFARRRRFNLATALPENFLHWLES